MLAVSQCFHKQHFAAVQSAGDDVYCLWCQRCVLVVLERREVDERWGVAVFMQYHLQGLYDYQ